MYHLLQKIIELINLWYPWGKNKKYNKIKLIRNLLGLILLCDCIFIIILFDEYYIYEQYYILWYIGYLNFGDIVINVI